MFKNLTLKGGGIRGYAYPPALQTLKKHGLLKDLKRIAGVSAGSIAAAFLACGVDIDYKLPELMEIDFAKFEDDSWGIVRDSYRLKKQYGWCPGEKAAEWINKSLKNITGNPNITFREAYDKTGIELRIIVTNLSKGRTEVFSYFNKPTMVIAYAVRMSMAIPIFYTPITYDDDLFVDGGLLCNFYNFPPELGETLGLYLVGDNDYVLGVDKNIDDLPSFIGNTLNLMLSQLEQRYISKTLWENTVKINTGNIQATDFRLKDAQKNFLKENAIKAAEEFVASYFATHGA